MLQLIIVLAVGVPIAHWLVALYARSVWRERLERKWDRGEGQGDREVFVGDGMEHFEKSILKRVIGLVYIIPVAVVILIAYVVNRS